MPLSLQVVVIISSYRREQAAAAREAVISEPPTGSTKTSVIDGSDIEHGRDAETVPLVVQQAKLSSRIELAPLQPER